MERVKRTTLFYQSGRSDKVYEVDLCRVESGYLVNFRYGRRGKKLREGTKTVNPVSETEGDRIYNQLIASKKASGYFEEGTQPTSTPPQPVTTSPNIPETSDPRHQAILTRLATRNETNWPLNRVIWRAGELKITQAVPYLLSLLGTETDLRDYCIIWALGWLNDREVIPTLRPFLQNKPDFIQRITNEAIFKLSTPEEQAQMQREKLAQIPSMLQHSITTGTVEELENTLNLYLTETQNYLILDPLYQINHPTFRPVLKQLLQTLPLTPPHFKPLRHIFKMAEYRQDAEIFAILAYRFEKTQGNFNHFKKWSYVNGRYVSLKEGYHTEQLKQPNTRYAYSKQTREYLQRRVWRTLKTLGEEGDTAYIPLATEILLQYADTDAQQAFKSPWSEWKRETYETITHWNYWDQFAAYQVLNHILYENSPRYQHHPHAWRIKAEYYQGETPTQREEAFSDLWTQHPASLLRLLSESRCYPVHQFALKAIQDCPQFITTLTLEQFIPLLQQPYPETVQFALTGIQSRYNATETHPEMLLALANCILPQGRQQAYQWIMAQRERLLVSGQFVVDILTSEEAETREFGRRLLGEGSLSPETSQIIIGHLISLLLGFSSEAQESLAEELGETLLTCFASPLQALGFGVILDLLEHPLAIVQGIGARILLNHTIPVEELPTDFIETLLASPVETVRTVGVQIFGQLPDNVLMRDRLLLIALAVNSNPDLRQSVRPIIARLASQDQEFGLDLALDFIDLLTDPERQKGVHKDLVTILQEDIPHWMPSLIPPDAFSLIRSKSAPAQELGGLILKEIGVQYLQEFNTIELVQLANHEILSVREAAWQIFTAYLPTIRHNSYEMRSVVRLLESKWQDSKDFAFQLFRELSADSWTPQILVSICDSIDEDARRFGRDLVMQYFQGEAGQEYLLKFSEHPSQDMQLFTTNYLEQYASDKPDNIAQLKEYFITVLSGVNQGKVAKERIFNFLAKESQKSKRVAAIVAEILTRQSVTMSITDRAKSIEIMLQIQQKYPHIILPLKFKKVTQVLN